MTLGDPAENEESGLQRAFGKERQEPFGIGDDTALHPIPLGTWQHTVERADVEVILHVNRHGVDDAGACGSAHCAPFRIRTVLIVFAMMKRSSASDMFLM